MRRPKCGASVKRGAKLLMEKTGGERLSLSLERDDWPGLTPAQGKDLVAALEWASGMLAWAGSADGAATSEEKDNDQA